MLPSSHKSRAPSIWSFDSGYGSNTLEDDDNFNVDYLKCSTTDQTLPSSAQGSRVGTTLGGPWNVHFEDQLRLRRSHSPVEPVTTKLNVFTAKAGVSTEFLFPAPGNDQDGCITCQLWEITNPGEGLKCGDCSHDSSIDPGHIPLFNEQLEGKSTVLKSKGPPPPQSLQPPKYEGTGRCSACEVSALIDNQSVTCPSCKPRTNLCFPLLPSQPSTVRRSSARPPPTKLESHAQRCLHAWLRENQKNPYPDTETKRSLAQQCGITEKQVSTWFTNARARRRLLVSPGQSNLGSEDEVSCSARLSSVASTALLNVEKEMPNHHVVQKNTTSRRGKKKDYGQEKPIGPVAPIVSAVAPMPTEGFDDTATCPSELWQCTFCYHQVAPKSWRRHEETQHRPKKKWTCLHTGPSITVPSPSGNVNVCVFCMAPNPNEEHFERSHRIVDCMGRPEEERTYLRPDHLRQHVRNFHKASLKDFVRDMWRWDGPAKDAVETWTCGFCAQELDTWDARETHVAAHFKHGLTMAEWKVCRPSEGRHARGRKRPTSSHASSGVLAKFARTLTASHPFTTFHPFDDDFVDTHHVPSYIAGTVTGEASFLPDIAFDTFAAEVCAAGDVFDYGVPHSFIQDRYCLTPQVCDDTTFLGDEAVGLNVDMSTGTGFDEDALDFFEPW